MIQAKDIKRVLRKMKNQFCGNSEYNHSHSKITNRFPLFSVCPSTRQVPPDLWSQLFSEERYPLASGPRSFPGEGDTPSPI